ncbi:AmiS/UreI family transporter [Spiractinospora alimapuensis]|uniref:AmiS/UreI family transporter n=1 Tax=Spiractinospora alimapuensis TaxID=2820884 RepID=UPI001F180963|nr:AmiS/UreI family transporter [Spiractinospora alimapuensis]QVQ52658.1 AmiS/UreI family transporter [Spiractinospora alimapuensis]
MVATGLFYVGAVLVVNGLMLLGTISPRAAAPLNLFVGTLQVVGPTVLLIQNGDTASVLEAAPLYLFGFTYLWVGINAITDWDPRGLGWFSLFVALSAIAMSLQSAVLAGDWPFTVIWLYWAVLWFLFFLVLGRGNSGLAPFTGWFAIVTGTVTAAFPGALLVVGLWPDTPATALVLLLLGVAAVGALWFSPVRNPEMNREPS